MGLYIDSLKHKPAASDGNFLIANKNHPKWHNWFLFDIDQTVVGITVLIWSNNKQLCLSWDSKEQVEKALKIYNIKEKITIIKRE